MVPLRKSALHLALVCIFTYSAAVPVHAADTGDLTGHVELGASKEALAGVQVQIKETGAKAVTGADGTFQFHGLAPGNYTLLTGYEGTPPVQTRVSVRAGTVTAQDVMLAAQVNAVQLVTVLGQRTSDAVARAAEKEAPNLINLTTIEEMLKLPDVNTGEAVRRIPGISLETDTGEGRFINIRGLDADLNSTTFGGLRLMPTNSASPFGGGRAVAMDSIPTGFVGAITVTKTNLPEQDAEALGGTIEITPKTVPADGKPFANIRVGGGYEALRNTPVTDLTGTAGGRFGDAGKFSALITGTYYEDKRGINDIEASYYDLQSSGVPDKAFSSFQQRYYQYHRKRHGYGLDLGYQPDGVSKYFLRYYDAGYSETVNRQQLQFNFGAASGGHPTGLSADPANPYGLVDTVNFDKTLRDEKEFIDTRVAEFGGKNHLGESLLDYHVGLSQGTYFKPYDFNADFGNSTVGVIHYNNISNPNFPSYTVTGVNPIDPAGYTLNSNGLVTSTQSTRDREWQIGVNLLMPLQLTGASDEDVKTGLNVRLRTRANSGNTFSYNTSGEPLSQFINGGNVTFYDNHYQNGPNIDMYGIRGLAALSSATAVAGAAASQYQDASENVYAGYGQYEANVGPVGLVGGVRVESTDARYNSNSVDANGNNLGAISAPHSYTDLFPSLQARYGLSPDLIARAAVSSTIARPGFNQVNASTTVQGNTITTGNPQLKPARATSLDLSLAKYLTHAGVLSVGVFDKEISDYIVHTTISQVVPNNPLYAGVVGQVGIFQTLANASGTSRALGGEFNYVQRLRDLLPWPWNGLGFSANYTYVASKFQIRPGETAQMPSTSRDTGNFELMYETSKVTATLGAYYVSKNLFGIGTSAANDVWSQPRFSLDFGSQYKIDRHLKLYADVKNLTNTPLKFTEGPQQYRPIQREFYDITALAGISYDF